jgi:hypothetical protein
MCSYRSRTLTPIFLSCTHGYTCLQMIGLGCLEYLPKYSMWESNPRMTSLKERRLTTCPIERKREPRCKALQDLFLYQLRCIVHKERAIMLGSLYTERESNPQQPVCKTGTLPLSHRRVSVLQNGFEPVRFAL